MQEQACDFPETSLPNLIFVSPSAPLTKPSGGPMAGIFTTPEEAWRQAPQEQGAQSALELAHDTEQESRLDFVTPVTTTPFSHDTPEVFPEVCHLLPSHSGFPQEQAHLTLRRPCNLPFVTCLMFYEILAVFHIATTLASASRPGTFPPPACTHFPEIPQVLQGFGGLPTGA